MGNIVDYVKEYGNFTFKELPFNEVDGLVLSQFAYFKWENVIPKLTDNSEGISISEMSKNMQPAEVFSYERYAKDNRKLWDAMVNSIRFGNMRCNYLATSFRKDVEVQFCAFLAIPKDSTPIVLFRGTDETILGWKEDYNMSFDTPIAGQRLASLYIKQVSLRFAENFIVSGHSKGGNLAVFSVMDNDEKIRRRVNAIYNYDGPHFRSEILDSRNYFGIIDRVYKFIPKSSVIGIMLEREHRYKVIKSKAIGGMSQHNPYTWLVEKDRFAEGKQIDTKSLKLNELISEAAKTMSNDEIEIVGNSIFGIIERSELSTTEELLKGGRKTLSAMLKAIRDMDEATRDKTKNILKDFIKILRNL